MPNRSLRFHFQGGLFGFLASLAAGLTLTVGSIFCATYAQIPKVPLTVEGCNTTASVAIGLIRTARGTNVTASNDVPFNFFNLSYLYYSPFCLLVGTVVAVLVSLATGRPCLLTS